MTREVPVRAAGIEALGKLPPALPEHPVESKVRTRASVRRRCGCMAAVSQTAVH
jgi:hypothetical protein